MLKKNKKRLGLHIIIKTISCVFHCRGEMTEPACDHKLKTTCIICERSPVGPGDAAKICVVAQTNNPCNSSETCPRRLLIINVNHIEIIGNGQPNVNTANARASRSECSIGKPWNMGQTSVARTSIQIYGQRTCSMVRWTLLPYKRQMITLKRVVGNANVHARIQLQLLQHRR